MRFADEFRQSAYSLFLGFSDSQLSQKEVVPVDTHVYQIAIKHYGMKGMKGGKAALSPKLYEDVNAKFFSIWGQYAGWAHTVRWLFLVKITHLISIIHRSYLPLI